METPSAAKGKAPHEKRDGKGFEKEKPQCLNSMKPLNRSALSLRIRRAGPADDRSKNNNLLSGGSGRS
jgi:hypothetical protein